MMMGTGEIMLDRILNRGFDGLPEDCAETMRLVMKMWDEPLPNDETCVSVRHMIECAACAKVFNDLQKMDMDDVRRKAMRRMSVMMLNA